MVSILLGVLVLGVLGVLIFNYFKFGDERDEPEGAIIISDENPCYEYRNWTLKDVPARCIKYFFGNE